MFFILTAAYMVYRIQLRTPTAYVLSVGIPNHPARYNPNNRFLNMKYRAQQP